MGGRVTIIIPVRNDAIALGRTLDHLEATGIAREADIVVAAAGDTEGTSAAVHDRAQIVWPGTSTRAALMNAGAATATGDVLFFLHADSFPPPDAVVLIERALVDGADRRRRVRASLRRTGMELARDHLHESRALPSDLQLLRGEEFSCAPTSSAASPASRTWRSMEDHDLRSSSRAGSSGQGTRTAVRATASRRHPQGPHCMVPRRSSPRNNAAAARRSGDPGRPRHHTRSL